MAKILEDLGWVIVLAVLCIILGIAIDNVRAEDKPKDPKPTYRAYTKDDEVERREFVMVLQTRVTITETIVSIPVADMYIEMVLSRIEDLFEQLGELREMRSKIIEEVDKVRLGKPEEEKM